MFASKHSSGRVDSKYSSSIIKQVLAKTGTYKRYCMVEPSRDDQDDEASGERQAKTPKTVQPLWKTLALTVWPLSGGKQQAFQKLCAMSSWHHGGALSRNGTKTHGGPGLAGVLKGTNVLFQRL